jgi:hypothetical protein
MASAGSPTSVAAPTAPLTIGALQMRLALE